MRTKKTDFVSDPNDFKKLSELSHKSLVDPTYENMRNRMEWLVASPDRMTDEMVQIRLRLYSDPEIIESMHNIFMIGKTPTWSYRWEEEDLQKFQPETLVFWTEHNPGQGPDYGEYMAGLFPNAKFYNMVDAAHWPQWEKPEEHDQVLIEFIKGSERERRQEPRVHRDRRGRPRRVATFATELLGLQARRAERRPAAPADGRPRVPDRGRAGHAGRAALPRLEVACPESWRQLTSHLRAKGIEVTEESSELCATRRVASMISTLGPVRQPARVLRRPRGGDRAVHLADRRAVRHRRHGARPRVLLVDDAKAFLDFYVETLGFRLSDILTPVPGIDVYFLHCNPRHHTIAAAAIPGMPPSLQHIMLQVDSIDTWVAPMTRRSVTASRWA